jgi:hypothetical protein
LTGTSLLLAASPLFGIRGPDLRGIRRSRYPRSGNLFECLYSGSSPRSCS